jgi:hypothetical protein
MNSCGKQRAPLPVRKPKHTGVALRHAATRNVIIAETVGNKLTIILIWKFGTNIVHLFVQNNVHKNKYYESNNNFHST